jgi:hypothetical protein
VDWVRVDPGTNLVQPAIDYAIANGKGVVYLARGNHLITSTIVIAGDSNSEELCVLGDGAGATRVVMLQNSNADAMRVERSHVSVRGAMFEAQGLPLDGRGIVVRSGSQGMEDISLRDVIVRSFARECLLATGDVSNLVLEHCIFAANIGTDGSGLVRLGPRCSNVTFIDCILDFFANAALNLDGASDVSVHGGSIEAGQVGVGAYVVGADAENCRFSGVWFEEPSNASTTRWFVDAGRNCHGWVLDSCYFVRQRSITDPDLKLVRLGACGSEPGGPALGGAIINPYAFTRFTGQPARGAIEIRDSASEVVVIGGVVETEAGGRYPVDVLDATTKSTWVGPRQWRLPQVGLSQTANSGRLGDTVARPGRGPESWNALAGGGSWLPLTVQRYPDLEALESVPSPSRGRGSVAWLDNPPTDESQLRVWDGAAWRQVVYS